MDHPELSHVFLGTPRPHRTILSPGQSAGSGCPRVSLRDLEKPSLEPEAARTRFPSQHSRRPACLRFSWATTRDAGTFKIHLKPHVATPWAPCKQTVLVSLLLARVCHDAVIAGRCCASGEGSSGPGLREPKLPSTPPGPTCRVRQTPHANATPGQRCLSVHPAQARPLPPAHGTHLSSGPSRLCCPD